MKYNYITIEREYGSGGTEIAQKLAKRCGIHCYGKEILQEVSKQEAIPIEQIEKYEETATDSFLYSMYMLGQSPDGMNGSGTKANRIHEAEVRAIRRLAANGRAVFLGHCASDALHAQNDVLHVFVHGNFADKKRRTIRNYKISPNEAEKTMRRFDRKRANYYNVNTSKKWDDWSNYDIVLNSSTLGVDGCVRVLSGFLKQALDSTELI